jgi:hypothetical protein
MTIMPHSKKWQRLLVNFYGSTTASSLVSKALTYYEQFSFQHAAEPNRNNRMILNKQILPGLSIYKALRDENDDQEKVLVEIEALFRQTFFTDRLQGIRLLNYFPNPFGIARFALKQMTAAKYIPGSQEVIVDNAECFAINVYRCFIFDILKIHNTPELTPLYCKTDDWLADALPTVSLERTKTLGRGDDCCDFRWCRIDHAHSTKEAK